MGLLICKQFLSLHAPLPPRMPVNSQVMFQNIMKSLNWMLGLLNVGLSRTSA